MSRNRPQGWVRTDLECDETSKAGHELSGYENSMGTKRLVTIAVGQNMQMYH